MTWQVRACCSTPVPITYWPSLYSSPTPHQRTIYFTAHRCTAQRTVYMCTAQVRLVGRRRLVLDLSCRRRDGHYWVVTDRWQRFSSLQLDEATLGR